jgi:hypothetical protein
MRRLVAVLLSGALIWQGAGGAVVLASPPDVRDDWGRIAALKPDQKVTVEVQTGRGKSQNGRFIGCDENFVMLRTGKGQDIAVARGDIRRVYATPPGREGFIVLGLIVAVAGGLALGIREVHRVNRCDTVDCLTPGVSPSYYLLLGAVAAGAVAIMSIGGPRRVYEVPKIDPPPAAPRGDTPGEPAAETSARGPATGIDPARTIARLRAAPTSRLRLNASRVMVPSMQGPAGSGGDAGPQIQPPR